MKTQKKILNLIIGLSLVIVSSPFNTKTTFAATKTIHSDMVFDTSSKKEWTITLSKDIDSSTLNTDTVKVLDDTNNKVDVSLKLVDGKSFKVIPPSNGYKLGEAYTLIIGNDVKDKSGKPMVNSYKKNFVVADNEDFIKPRDNINTLMKLFTKGVRPNFSWETSAITIREQGGFKQPAWGVIGSGLDAERKPAIQNKWAAMKKGVDEFDAIYNNKTYSDISDVDYYKKMPNLKVNFDLANNRSYNTNNPLRELFPNTMHPSQRFVWRTDFEKEFIQEINKRRIAKGLEPLQYDNDLTAMARWGAKRNAFMPPFSRFPTYESYNGPNTEQQLKDFGLDSFIGSGVETETGTPDPTAVNSIPQMFEKDMKRIDDIGCYLGTETTELYEKQLVANPEKHINEVFPNVNKDIKFLSGGDTMLYKPSQFLDIWEKSFKNFLVVPKLKEEFDLKDYKPLEIEGSGVGFKYKDLNNYLYNPKLKKIGIGAAYQLPIRNHDGNGYLNFAMFLSE